MSLVSLREFARMRGVTLNAVQKAVASSRISIAKTETHGTQVWKFVDPDIASTEWDKNTDPVQQRVATRADMGKVDTSIRTPTARQSDAAQTSLFPEEKNAPIGGKSKNETSSHGDIYYKARGAKEVWEARQAELDFKKSSGKLVDVDLLKPKLFNVAAQAQEKILNIPFRISSMIHAKMKAYILELKDNPESVLDEKEIQDIMSGEIKLILQQVSDGLNI